LLEGVRRGVLLPDGGCQALIRLHKCSTAR
jgi:hypothetical protein